MGWVGPRTILSAGLRHSSFLLASHRSAAPSLLSGASILPPGNWQFGTRLIRCGRVRTTDGIKGSFVDYSEPGQHGRAPRRQDREGERPRSTMDSRTRRRTGGGVALDTTSPSHRRASRSRPLPLTCTTSTTYLLRSLPVSNHVSLSLAHPFPLSLSLVLTPVFLSLTFSQRSMYDSTITPLPTDVYLGNAQRS